MKVNMHFWSHIAQFFLEWEMFQTKVVYKSKHTFYIQWRVFEFVPFMR